MAQTPTTPFSADSSSELPVGVQLGWRLRSLIAAGRLEAGDRMPGVRTMAEWAGVNVNTVRAVYARLEDEGLIVTRHGRGSFVADEARGSAEVEQIVAEALEAARRAGVDPRDVAVTALVATGLEDAIAGDLPDEADGEPDLAALATELELDEAWRNADEGAARRELRRQIGRLEAELASYTRDEPAPRPPLLNPLEPRIASAGELAQTRDELLAKVAEARASAARRATRERRAREVRDAMVADPAGHRWEVVSSAETGEPGCVDWSVGPRMGPLGALMSWWRVKVSGGCPLPRGPRDGR
jgi:DNA-binding transcriptional regulator YhcF (GntR family)